MKTWPSSPPHATSSSLGPERGGGGGKRAEYESPHLFQVLNREAREWARTVTAGVAPKYNNTLSSSTLLHHQSHPANMWGGQWFPQARLLVQSKPLSLAHIHMSTSTDTTSPHTNHVHIPLALRLTQERGLLDVGLHIALANVTLQQRSRRSRQRLTNIGAAATLVWSPAGALAAPQGRPLRCNALA